MATVTVQAGICGFTAVIVTQANDDYDVKLNITSDCKRVAALAETLTQVSALSEISQPVTRTATYQAASGAKLHAACPVPSAIIKAIEVAAGLALPKDAHITVSRD